MVHEGVMVHPGADHVEDMGGDDSAMDPAVLWREFGPPLHGFLARRVPPGVDAEDLLQDVFLRVIRSLGRLPPVERPEAWLFQIARNALRDSLRARLRRDGRTDSLEIDLPSDKGAASERDAAAELAPCLTGMVDRLAEPYRTAIALTSLQGVSQADAARQLGISNSGMKSRVQRGRAQLREMLAGCCAIAVDARGGVSDFHKLNSAPCGEPAPASSTCPPSSCAVGAARVASKD